MRHRHATRPSALRWALTGLLCGLPAACQDADLSDQGSLGPGAVNLDPIPPSTAGTQGCNGADQAFAACTEIDLSGALSQLAPTVSSLTRIAAAQSGSDLLYATAVYSASGDSTVLELDLADPLNPVVTNLLPAGALDAYVSNALGASAQGVLGGLCVLDGSNLVAVELATNTLVAVGRSAPGGLFPFAGLASSAGGFLDGSAATARFSLDPESQVLSTADGRVFVADTDNNAVRLVIGNPLFAPSSVLTLVGTGPGMGGFADGDLASAMLDDPTGLVATCSDQVLVTERAGNRVRTLSLFGFDPFLGALTGAVSTLAGDGTSATTGGPLAVVQVAAPTGPQSSADGEVYWIDAQTGSLRRLSSSAGSVDCPLSAGGGCALASQLCSPGSDDFTPGASFSTAVSGAGDLFVLESGTTLLRRFGP